MIKSPSWYDVYQQHDISNKRFCQLLLAFSENLNFTYYFVFHEVIFHFFPCFNKVFIFWEGRKCFDKTTQLICFFLVNNKSTRIFFNIFFVFSEYMNFKVCTWNHKKRVLLQKGFNQKADLKNSDLLSGLSSQSPPSQSIT